MSLLLNQTPMQLSLLLILLPLSLLLLLHRRSLKRSPLYHLPLPPGPRPLPVLGNMSLIPLLTHRGLASLASQYGGILHLRLGSLHAVAISNPEFARHVLQLQDNIFSNRPATAAISYLTYDRADMAFAHYGPFWRQMRKLCVVKLFSRKRAESWASVRDEVRSTLRSIAASASSSSPVDVGEMVFNLMKNTIFRAAFGTPSDEEQDEFIAILQEFSKLFGAFNLGDFLPWLGWVDVSGLRKRLKAARGALDRFIDKIIDEHRARGAVDEGEGDMVDEMLAFLEEEKGIGGDEGHVACVFAGFALEFAVFGLVHFAVAFEGLDSVHQEGVGLRLGGGREKKRERERDWKGGEKGGGGGAGEGFSSAGEKLGNRKNNLQRSLSNFPKKHLWHTEEQLIF